MGKKCHYSGFVNALNLEVAGLNPGTSVILKVIRPGTGFIQPREDNTGVAPLGDVSHIFIFLFKDLLLILKILIFLFQVF